VIDRAADYARTVADALNELDIRTDLDVRNEKIGYKIRAAQLEKVPYMLVIGEKEAQNGEVSVRARVGGDLGTAKPDDFAQTVLREIRTRALCAAVHGQPAKGDGERQS
jgi:threonyl-tRNA synthetase